MYKYTISNVTLNGEKELTINLKVDITHQVGYQLILFKNTKSGKVECSELAIESLWEEYALLTTVSLNIVNLEILQHCISRLKTVMLWLDQRIQQPQDFDILTILYDKSIPHIQTGITDYQIALLTPHDTKLIGDFKDIKPLYDTNK
jgi:hypothetical protein